jgi:hypothetical protein
MVAKAMTIAVHAMYLSLELLDEKRLQTKLQGHKSTEDQTL